GRQEGGHVDSERNRERAERADAGLALAVLDEGELRRREAGRRRDVVERETGAGPEVPDAAPERDEVHRLTIAKDRAIFTRPRWGIERSREQGWKQDGLPTPAAHARSHR